MWIQVTWTKTWVAAGTDFSLCFVEFAAVNWILSLHVWRNQVIHRETRCWTKKYLEVPTWFWVPGAEARSFHYVCCFPEVWDFMNISGHCFLLHWWISGTNCTGLGYVFIFTCVDRRDNIPDGGKWPLSFALRKQATTPKFCDIFWNSRQFSSLLKHI
jgi:hypothetical protein